MIIAAGSIGAQGKIGKAMGDVVENTFEKFPNATPPIATGLMRKMLGGHNENVGEKAIDDAETKYKKAIRRNIQSNINHYGIKKQYLPDDNSSFIVKKHINLYMENK